MCPTHCRRCWAWWALVTVLGFSVLERRGWSNKCHRTLSREIKELGPVAAWTVAIAGPLFALHLITLPDLEA